MTRAETILDALSQWKPTGDGPFTNRIAIADDVAATLTADRADSLSVLLSDISLSIGSARSISAAELTEHAVNMASRVTGLADPLKVYEIDSARSLAKLRSSTPAVRGDTVLYFEMELHGRHVASLKRYRASTARGGREAIAFPLTHEALAKVIEEVVGS